jgi:3-oxoacyl-[acyl-carrier protein] reductase
LISGAAHGIGFAIAERLLRDGSWDLALVDVDARGLRAARERLSEMLPAETQVRAWHASISDTAAVARAIDEAGSAMSPVLGAIHAAGLAGVRSRVVEMAETTWDLMLSTHLTGAFCLARNVLPGMIKHNHGRIVFITSTAAWDPGPGIAAYAAAKAGVTGFSRSLAAEIGEQGVTVNCVAAGLTATERLRRLQSDDELAERAGRLGVVVGPRPADTSEIAAAVAYLFSDEAAFVTGSTIHVNGGSYMP